MMRTALAAVSGILMATPLTAAGYVGAGYTLETMEFGSASFDSDHWQADGAFGFAEGEFGGQVDASVDSDEVVDTFTLTGHAYWAGQGWRLGGYVSHAQADNDFDPDLKVSISGISYGVEVTRDLGKDIVGRASAGLGVETYKTSSPIFALPGEITIDTWNIDAGLLYYITPNARLDATIGFEHRSQTFLEDDRTTFAIKGEFQPWSAPVSITAGYRHIESDNSAGPEFAVAADELSIGLRWSFGGESIRDRDKTTPFDAR